MCPEYKSRSWVFSPLPSTPSSFPPHFQPGRLGLFHPLNDLPRTNGEWGAPFPSVGPPKREHQPLIQFPSVTNYAYNGLKIDVSNRDMNVWHLCQTGTAQVRESAVTTWLILLYLNKAKSGAFLHNCARGAGLFLSNNITYTVFISLLVLPVHPFSVTAKVWTCPRTRFLHHSPI